MDTPLVSIVTPVLNGEKWIAECVESVRRQDYPNIEHIIMDGVSSDGTLEICRRYPHLIIRSEKDTGQSQAINRGFEISRGEILGWLCADDLLMPGAISAVVTALGSEKDVVMGRSQWIDAGANVIGDHPVNDHPYYDHKMLVAFWNYHPISQPATYWTRRLWERCGPLDESLYFAMDYDLWLKMSLRCRFDRIDHLVAQYRIHPEAKCFADTYSTRLELLRTGKAAWPPLSHLRFWKLFFGYLFSKSEITAHWYAGRQLLLAANGDIDRQRLLLAACRLLKAHLRHPAVVEIPEYRPIRNRLLAQWRWPGRLKQLVKMARV